MLRSLSRGLRTCVAAVTVFFAIEAWATDPYEICLAMAKSAARNVRISQGNSTFNNNVFNSYCFKDGSFNSGSSGLGLNAVIPEINVPVGISWNGSNTSQYMTAWCQQNQSTYAGGQSNFDLNSAIDSGYYGGVNGCIAAVTNGSYIQPLFTADLSHMTIGFHVGNTEFKNLGIVPSTGVTCRDPSNRVVTGKIGNGTLASNSGDFNVQCTRTADSVPGHAGESSFNNATITVSGFPNGLTVLWPKDETLAPDDAQLVQSTIQALTAQLAQLQAKYTQVKDEVNLVGGVITSAQFIISNSCPTHYTYISTLLLAHNYRNVANPLQNDPADPASAYGFSNNDALFLANPGWGLLHPVLCQLDAGTKGQLVIP